MKDVKTRRAEVQIGNPLWPEQLKRLRERLKGTPKSDSLMVGIISLIQENISSELGPLCSPLGSDSELNRLAGRIGMLVDLKLELEHLWDDCLAQTQGQIAPVSP